jgi:hypothetical protein
MSYMLPIIFFVTFLLVKVDFVYKCVSFFYCFGNVFLSLVVCLYSVWEVFSAWRSKNQFLFMFTGCVKCCTFLFIDVTVGRFMLLFVLCFRFFF